MQRWLQKYYRMVTEKRHIAKAITWRLIATSITFLLLFIFTENATMASKITIFSIVIKTTLYYCHERLWYKTKWGIKNGY